MSTITWLHLSDIHYCEPKTGWDADEILESLLDDLKLMEEKHNLQPDLVFFTGDLAYGHIKNDAGWNLKDQYEGVNKFIDAIRKSFKKEIPKTNIFLVPGNHDVDRTKLAKKDTFWLDNQKDEKEIINMIEQKDTSWQDYIRRLICYREFLEQYEFNHLLTDPDRLVYALKRQIGNIVVGIGGFNSAWSCSRSSNEEKGKLWMGAKWQMNTIRKHLKDTKFNITLLHHPPNWFVEREDKKFLTSLQEKFSFCLHGHEHFEWVHELANGHTTISADACYENSAGENGYNFVKLDFEKSTGEVWLREYKSTGAGGWIPKIQPGKTDNNGTWTLRNTGWMKGIKNDSENIETSSKSNFIMSISDIKSHQKVELAFDINKLDPRGLENLKSVLSQILQIDERYIPIIDVKKGSTIVTIKLPSDKAGELEDQFKRGSDGIKQLRNQFALTNIELQEYDFLLIDDSPAWQEIVTETFYGVYSCDVASSYEDVIEKIGSQKYKVICVSIPFYNYHKTRQILIFLKDKYFHLPVILITTLEEENLDIQNRYPNIKYVVIKGRKHYIDDLEDAISKTLKEGNMILEQRTTTTKVADIGRPLKSTDLTDKKRVIIFISYASEDYNTAKRLYDDLKREGITPWLDREDLLSGQDWTITIPKIIRDSAYFLLLISENSVSKTGYIQKEQKIALDILDEFPPDKIFIVPARLDKTEPVYEKLKNLHWADLSDYEKGFQQILRTLQLGNPSLKKDQQNDIKEETESKPYKEDNMILEQLTTTTIGAAIPFLFDRLTKLADRLDKAQLAKIEAKKKEIQAMPVKTEQDVAAVQKSVTELKSIPHDDITKDIDNFISQMEMLRKSDNQIIAAGGILADILTQKREYEQNLETKGDIADMEAELRNDIREYRKKLKLGDSGTEERKKLDKRIGFALDMIKG